MNQEKIGKFIASCRKEKSLTQLDLAEKLYITDRAVSKWETGKSLPDVDIMLDLCDILGISVTELLIGERVKMEDLKKETEKEMLEMAKKEKVFRGKLLFALLSILVLCISTSVIMILAATHGNIDTIWRNALIVLAINFIEIVLLVVLQ